MKNKIILLVTMLVLLTGCSKEKEAISGAEFKKIVTENTYEVVDVTNIYDYAKSAYLIKDDNYKIMFIEGKKIGDIQSTYTDEVTNIYSNIYSDNTRNNDKGEKWSYVELEDEDHYYYLCYINKTLVIVESDIENKNNMIDLLKKIEYYK